ncbi:SRPBCC family protein [Dietzia sp. B32]|uniref:SRPBCC family protein n=1 Tax=Dietzia sp. B32 TaxID=2915130 RepID=UPI0021AE1428|nr:SRPBCC family protein [Dietzia sp. B32]UVE96411.1 SRPBCC family protein [Dietzia sp. B32]
MDASAEVDIFAPPEEVWNLIRPAENAVHLDPSTMRAFQVPGTPSGVGEIQGSISRLNGREYVAMIEVLEEVQNRYALTRSIGVDDDALRMAYILRPTRSGTRLELRTTFTIPAELWDKTDVLIDDVRRRHHEMAQRIKWVIEADVPYAGKSGSSA